MDIKEALNHIINQLDLTAEEIQAVMRQIMTGQCTDAQIGAFLVDARMRSETIDGVVSAVVVMRELVDGVQSPTLKHVVDMIGTGDNSTDIFNVSSAASFVVAAADGKVVEHGDRAVSDRSGSADLLEAAGIHLELISEQMACCIDTVGVGFMFTQVHHKAMKYAAGPCRESGLRTLFNMLGPLTSPAGVEHQVIGVLTQELCKPLAKVLKRLSGEYALVVRSRGGLDEFNLVAATHIAKLKDGEVRKYEVRPEDFGIKSQALMGLEVDSPQASPELIRGILGRRKTEAGQKAAELIVMNAGPILYATDLATSLYEDIQPARDAPRTGLVREKIDELVAFTAIYREENTQ